MSILRSALNLRPIVRTRAVPSLTRGIRNYDVNTPTEGATASAIEGDGEPSLDAAAKAQESETANVDFEKKAFVDANKKFMDSDSDKGTGGLNKETVNLEVEQDIGKGNPDSF